MIGYGRAKEDKRSNERFPFGNSNREDIDEILELFTGSCSNVRITDNATREQLSLMPTHSWGILPERAPRMKSIAHVPRTLQYMVSGVNGLGVIKWTRNN